VGVKQLLLWVASLLMDWACCWHGAVSGGIEPDAVLDHDLCSNQSGQNMQM
jgi:hypothetical protein